MKKSSLISILVIALISFAIFYGLAMLAYPSVINWLIKGTETGYFLIVNDPPESHAITASLFMGLVAFCVASGVIWTSRNRTKKHKVIIFFIILDVAVLAAIFWLGVLKYRLVNLSKDLAEMAEEIGGGMTLPIEEGVRLYEVGLFASLIVLVVTWIYSKRKLFDPEEALKKEVDELHEKNK